LIKLKPLSDEFFLTSKTSLKILVLFIFIVAAYLRLSFPEACYFNEFAERDWYRTFQIFKGEVFHTASSELTQGGRAPGPFLYWLQLIPMVFSTDPYALFYFIGVLNLVALYFCYRFGVKYLGFTAGVISLGLFTAFPLATMGLRYLWNPALLFPFVVITLYCLVAPLKKPRPLYLYTVVIAIPIAISCHISALYLIPITIIFYIIFRPKYSIKHYGIAVVLLLVMFLPFMIGELQNGFENLGPIVKPPDKVSMAGYEREVTLPTRYLFNPSAKEGFLFNAYPRMWNEFPYFGAFTYFTLFIEEFPNYFSSFCQKILEIFLALAPVHLLLYLASYVYAIWKLIGLRKNKDEKYSPLKAALFLCLIWPLIILVTQTFLVFSSSKEALGSGVHYFFIIYPTQFLIIGFFLYEAVKYFEKQKEISLPIISGLCLWLILQVVIVSFQLRWSAESGYSIRFITTPASNLGVARKVADVLVDKLDITRQTYITHVQELDHILNYGWGTESGLDFLVNQHPRIKDSDQTVDSLKAAKFVYIIDRNLNHPDLKKYKIEEMINIGPISLCVSSQGTPRRLKKHHPMLNPFIHFSD